MGRAAAYQHPSVVVHSSRRRATFNLLFVAGLVSTAARAQSPPVPSPISRSSTATPFVDVRLALSAAAAGRFSEARFRRLLAFELEDTGHLATQLAGSLGDRVAHVWIDISGVDHVAIEVRCANRALARRTIRVAGTPEAVAERLVALATAEIVRAQSRPERPKKSQCPKDPLSHDDDLPAGHRFSLIWNGEVLGAWLPQNGGYLYGPGAHLGVAVGPLDQRVFARWLIGAPSQSGPSMRWIEAGLAADHVVFDRISWRLSLGALASAAAVKILRAASGSSVDTWSAKAAASAAIEARVGRSAWLAFALEPGLILHPVPFTASGHPASLQGAWMGISLALRVEPRLPSPERH